ncbi:MAG TPA: hypothetical protein VK538_01200, partial [Solirubrobacteraceae bacterium]|nr:hypothetical protein [Solirubrobacteraceae bacterium]
SGIAVSQAPTDTGQPVAETTSGSAHRAGATRNPFAPLPGAKAAQAASTATSGSTTSSSSSSTSSSTTPTSPESGGGSSSGGATPTPETRKPAAKEKSQTVYHVAVRFGTAPAGTPPLTAQLTPYDDLKRQQPLPDAKQPLIVFRGVIAGGNRATFTLVGEAILRGSAVCLPSASQCQAINLRPGQTEELEYIPLGGAAITYQLQIVSITSSKASASAASRSFKRQSKSGLQLLRHAGLTALPGLRYSRAKGVLVFKSRHASAARAHVAAWGAHL